MPRQRGETDVQWMERVKQVRMFINRTTNMGNQEENELRGFMALFFPNIPAEEVDKLVRESKKEAYR